MGLARRQFLQSIAAGYLGWQFGALDRVAQAAELYGKKIGRSTKRKLALLIGINQYDAKGDWLPLNGCLTDVELQRELLIHRFGFNPVDIVSLTDQQATKQAIAQAFTEHLIAQALPDDIVVVHFSGHGSRVGNHNTLVPVDGGIPAAGQIVNDISEDTLWQWLSAIATDQITCVLDTGYTHPGTPVVGNFRVRARPSRRDWQFSPDDVSVSSGQSSSKSGLLPTKSGIVLQATSNNQLCADALWQGFSSGVFTYALTQQLWQMTPATSVHVVLSNVLNTLEQKAFPSEELGIEKQLAAHIEGTSIKQQSMPMYFSQTDYLSTKHLANSDVASADGVITTVTSDRRVGETWLAGLPISSLGYYGIGSVLESATSNSPTLVQVKSHNGLVAKVEVLTEGHKLQLGQLLQERIRAVPRNLGLSVALDLSLSKIERIDATSAISNLPNMFGVTASEQFADCLFGANESSYGLFSVGRNPVLGSFGSIAESVGSAIRRLQPQLEALLAAKLIRLTANQGSSCVGLRASLKLLNDTNPTPVTLATKVTHRAEPSYVNNVNNTVNKCLTIGDRLSCHLENLTDQPLHVRIFIFDPRGKVISPNFVFSPYASDTIIPAFQTLEIPQSLAPYDWLVSAPQGLVDVQIVVSHTPLTQTLNLIELYSRQATSPTGMVVINNPLQVAQALLDDLHQLDGLASSTDESWLLNVNNWATLGFNYRVA